ncbi:MAG: SUMF1/EgtB/PvdO family nonheme iron enzyme [Armatimonadetes bacterium]|nr:SUMF1/EgtB/PvdO family nonheme iron enzyme [Armatimonadota bacterium]
MRHLPSALILALGLCLLPARGRAAEPVAGLGVVTQSEPSAGEAAARDLGVRVFGGRAVPDLGALPADLRVLWWHSEHAGLAPALTAKSRQALKAWLGEGHGLLLTGTAGMVLNALGLEPAALRTGAGGSDRSVVGVTPVGKHPVFDGFPADKPILLVSAGFPAFSDFHGSGGPMAGLRLGTAYPDAGENPLNEHACGKGRIIHLGWRLAYYALADNAHRANLEQLTRNALTYLAAGQWVGTMPDPKAALAAMRTTAKFDAAALRRAIDDLSATFGERYPKAAAYREAVTRLEALPAGQQPTMELAATLREAMLANPLLDFDQLLAVRRGAGQLGLPTNWQSNSSLPRRGYDNELVSISLRDAEEPPTTIYRPENGEFVGDVDLDFGARRVLFSMPGPDGRWQVYQQSLDGDAKLLPTVDEPAVDNYDACWLPDGAVMFTSTAPFTGVPCVQGSDHVANLYRRETDGTVRQLTFEQDHDWCPTVMPDGKVLYLRWEYSDIPHFVSRILFTMRPDGTNQGEFYGSGSYWPNAMFYARPVPGSTSKFVGVVGGHHDNPRMGELVVFDAARGRHEAEGVIQRVPGWGKKVEPVILDGLTGASWPKFLHPYPLSDKYFLVSCKPTPNAPWGLYLADVFDNMTLLREEPGYAWLEPLPLKPTATPPVLPDATKKDAKDATVYIADVYQGPGLQGVPRGTVKSLRLFGYHFAYHNMGGQINRVGIDGPWDIKRVLGTVPVADDGSAYFRIPANTPLSVQPLDDRGQALQLMRSWFTGMPGEVVSCTGCHAPMNGATAKPMQPKALKAPPEDIRPFYGETRGFSYQREVQPVVDAHCVRCHDGDKAAPDLRDGPLINPPGPDNGYRSGSHFTQSYLSLKRYVRNATMESDIHLLTPGEFAADTTWLVQMLRKGHHGVNLEPEAWDRLITWIDLNTPAHGTWADIVGAKMVTDFRDKRRAMFTKYAGRDEDPEAIYPVSYKAPKQVAADPAAIVRDQMAALPVPAAPAAATGQTRSLDLGGGVSLELVKVPAGEYLMGEGGTFPDEGPPRLVRIAQPYWLGRCEVSNAQFARFDVEHDSRLETGEYLQFGIAERGWPTNGPTQPVVRVSWDRAMAFCRWASKLTGATVSLPSEAEWEYACRAGSRTALSFGGVDTDFGKLANLADATLHAVYRVSAPVGSYQPNAWGLCDMHGNVAEWTRSAYGPHPTADETAGSAKAVRGGSWYDPPQRARAASRRSYPAYRRVFDVGFRVLVAQ